MSATSVSSRIRNDSSKYLGSRFNTARPAMTPVTTLRPAYKPIASCMGRPLASAPTMAPGVMNRVRPVMMPISDRWDAS
ncbi:MAG: hypothetical protein ACE5GO_05490 [Anaerolineales bacterium]